MAKNNQSMTRSAFYAVQRSIQRSDMKAVQRSVQRSGTSTFIVPFSVQIEIFEFQKNC